MNTKTIGDISEACVIAECLKLGFNVALPFGDKNRYDLILDLPEGLKKVQIKTAQFKKDHLIIRAYSLSTKNGKLIKNSYNGDVDYIIGFCSETNKLYVFKPENFGKNSVIRLRLSASKNNQKKRVNLASNFELTKLSFSLIG